MSVELTFTIEGETQLSRELGVSASRIKDWREPLAETGSELLKAFQLNYSSRGQLFQPGGWQPRKDMHSWPLLEKTGTMRNAFSSEVGANTVTLSNPTPYFPYHQSRQPHHKLPRRIMMKIDAERAKQIVKIFQKHIVNATKNIRGV